MKNRNLNKEGCGLGLTISRNIANALNGDLKVQSEVGKGSVFSLVIPYDRSLKLLKQYNNQSKFLISDIKQDQE